MLKRKDLDIHYLEVGAVFALYEKLQELDRPEQDFKLSKCLSYSLFIFNIIKNRYLEKFPPQLAEKLGHSINVATASEWIEGFQFLEADGQTRRPKSPTRYQLLNWIRNTITHYRDEMPRNTPPPWRRGLTIETRSTDGIRKFAMNGHISKSTDRKPAPMMMGRTDRRRLTKIVKYYVDIYEESLREAGINVAMSAATERARDIETEA